MTTDSGTRSEPVTNTDDEAPETEAAETKAAATKTPATEAAETKTSETKAAKTKASGGSGRRGVQVPLNWLIAGLVIVALAVALGIYIHRDIDHNNTRDAEAKAEEIAGRYAVNAATLDYQDLGTWVANMKNGVSPELQKKYDVIGQSMDQLLVPLKFQATGTEVVAKTVDHTGDLYRVVAVVSVNAKNAQIPDGASNYAVYSLTLDKGRNWMITSVGDAATGGAGQSLPGLPGT
ncbi:MAG: hypothetical protein WAV90_11010, partial [Gordonia amarae]